MGGISEGYETLWKLVIRPPRSEYDITELPNKSISYTGKMIKRTDFEIKNPRGLTLQCSHFQPIHRPCDQLPCVIYLHGNSSSRIQGAHYVYQIIDMGSTLVVFDFAGCGQSEGQYISLGYYQKDDIRAVVQHLRDLKTVNTIGLWGRSMGAISALMYSEEDPSISALVLDSPFSSLEEVCQHLVSKHVSFPGLFSIAFKMLSSTIEDKISVNIKELRPIDRVDKAFIPAYFIHAKGDELIPYDHSVRLHEKYASQYKNLQLIEGTHQSVRPEYQMFGIITFLHKWMQVEKYISSFEDKQQDSDLQAALKISMMD